MDSEKKHDILFVLIGEKKAKVSRKQKQNRTNVCMQQSD
jgi:hypothetical protein